ncbi:MAG: hypothetical protein HeimC2_44710 [Candidatus Heimdallarchaeota archaeon LC_2]|nr:MAG: hypothetical protein HeimC2_44710 [Candidatus Heimdallarchaeota archaeon LC_2]
MEEKKYLKTEKQLLENLNNNTLRVYYLLVKDKTQYSPIEVKTIFDFSSRSAAHYHLNKLFLIGLIDKTPQGKYFVEKDKVKSQIIEQYVRFLSFWIPKIMIYNIILLSLSAVSLILWKLDSPNIVWFQFYFPITLILAVLYFIESYKLVNRLKIS